MADCTRAMPSDRTTSAATPMMCGRLSRYDALLERLGQDIEDMAAELGQFIQEAHAMMGQRHVAGHRHVAPTAQPHI
jgi:hypothetical protein